MRRIFCFSVIVLLVAAYTATVLATDTIYGPMAIQNEKNKTTIDDKFKAKKNQEARLIVLNGDDGKKARQVKITLNGKLLVSRKQVNSKVSEYSALVTLKKKNTIKIISKGKGAGITVKINDAATDDTLFKTVVGVGDSILAGVQDGILEEPTQTWSFGKQLMDVVKESFVIPWITEPGIPARFIRMVDGSPVAVVNTTDGYRKNPGEQAYNLAVPGAEVGTSLRTKTSESNAVYEAVLGGNKTMVQLAKDLKPTFIIFWLGSNDALEMALQTDPGAHTDPEQFRTDYETLLKELQSTGAEFIASNIPDVSIIAYLVEPPALLGVPAGYKIGAIHLIDFFLEGTIPVLTDDDILTTQELAQMTQTVQELNVIIKELCEKYNVPLLDAYTLMHDWNDNGIDVDGTTLTLKLFGGFFSLDGVHPSNTGSALVANEYIKRINLEYNQNLALIDVAEVMKDDPNKPSDFYTFEEKLGMMDKAVFENTIRMLSHKKETRPQR